MGNLDWQTFTYWQWWILGCVLLIFELLLPAIFLIWIGLAAIVVGVLVLLVPGLPSEWQLLSFAILSAGFIPLGRHYFITTRVKSDHPLLGKRGQQYVDRVLTLEEPIVDGVGRVNVDDGSWRVQGEDAPLGTRVRVIGVSSATLIVKRLPD